MSLPSYVAVLNMAVLIILKIMKKNSDLKKLGANIAKLRKNSGISQDDLALEAEIGRRTVERLEVGETDVRFTTLVKIAKVLNVDVKVLVDF
jgi:DNA-binding XRE family transcriptional regulator